MKANTVIPVLGALIEIIVPSEDTNYTLCVGVETTPAGGGPPPHRHLREEETFVVLKGDYEFYDGQEWSRMKNGELRHSLRGNYHAFRNIGTTDGKMLFQTNGGGLCEYFEVISSLVLPKDTPRLTELSQYYNYEFKAPEPAHA